MGPKPHPEHPPPAQPEECHLAFKSGMVDGGWDVSAGVRGGGSAIGETDGDGTVPASHLGRIFTLSISVSEEGVDAGLATLSAVRGEGRQDCINRLEAPALLLCCSWSCSLF